jgi:TrmH family RNA methyltransferase
MLSKNQVKYVHSLRMGKFRDSNHEFLAEGIKLVDDLLNSDYIVRQIFAIPEWLYANADLAKSRNCSIQEVTVDELGKISNLVTPNEVLAIVAIPESSIPDPVNMGPLVLLLDRIQDPGNLGTIIRTADWFGISHIFCSEDTADLYNPKVVQSTMGSICRVKVHYTSLGSMIEELKGNWTIYGTFADGKIIYEAELKVPAAVIIGNESKGISRGLFPMITEKIGIPAVSHGAESLNASVATGIICSEFSRRLTVGSWQLAGGI